MTQRFPFLFNWKSTLCMHGVDKETFANQRGTNTMFRCSDSIGSCISVLLHCLVRYPIASSRHGPRAPVCASRGPVTYKGINSLVLTITSLFYTLVKKILNWSFSTLFFSWPPTRLHQHTTTHCHFFPLSGNMQCFSLSLDKFSSLCINNLYPFLPLE